MGQGLWLAVWVAVWLGGGLAAGLAAGLGGQLGEGPGESVPEGPSWSLSGSVARVARVREEILAHYDKRIRPPSEEGEGAVLVKVALVPQYVEGIDESESRFAMLVGLDLYWNDPRLRWDAQRHLNQTCIFTEVGEIWVPEVRFTMAMRDESDISPRSVLRICSEGLVHLTEFRRVSRFAKFDTHNFPLDEQNLIVGFAQTSAGVQEVNMSLITDNTTMAEKRLVLPADWKLKKIRCRRYQLRSMNEVHPQEYAAIYCFVGVRRDPAHVVINFCVPTFVVTLLAVLAIHSAESAQGPRTAKYELGLVSLMSVSVLTLSMTDSLPHSGRLSRLHVFYYTMMASIFSSCFISWLTVVADKRIAAQSRRVASGLRPSAGKGTGKGRPSLQTPSLPSASPASPSRGSPDAGARNGGAREEERPLRADRRRKPPPYFPLRKRHLKMADAASAALHVLLLTACFLWFLLGTQF